MSSSDFSDGDGRTNRCCPKRIADVVSNFCSIKKMLVNDISFQGMLKVPSIKFLDRRFTISLLNKIDIKKRAIRVDEHTYIDLCAEDVHRYLQIPKGPKKLFGLEDRSESEKMDFIRFGIGSTAFDIDEKNSLKAAEEIVSAQYPNGMTPSQADQFKVAFVCFAMGNFLIAKYSFNHGIKDFWGSLMNPSEIDSYNFCQAVLDEIIECARHVQKETKANRPIKNVSGCHLFLQAKFLDSNNLGSLNIPESVSPRIEVFTFHILQQMIKVLHPSSNSSDGYDTPTTGIQKVSNNNSTLKRLPPNNKVKTGSPAMMNQLYNPRKPASTAYLAAYTSGGVDKRLNDKQIDDLRLHNARMKLYINNFKTKASLELQAYFLANPTVMAIFNCNVDQLMTQVLDQVLILSTSLHDHTEVSKAASLNSPSLHTSSKRSSDNIISGYESNTDSYSLKRSKIDNFITGKNLLPDLTNVASPSSSSLHTPTTYKAGFVTPNSSLIKETPSSSYSGQNACGLNDLTFSNSMSPSPSEMNPSASTLKGENMRTPYELVRVPAVSTPLIETQSGQLDKNVADTDDLDLNQYPINADYIDCPVQKIGVQKGRMAKNPWFYGAPRKVVPKEVAETFFNWLSVTKSNCLDSIWVKHCKPKTIIIAGNDFKTVFTKGHNFTADLFDLAIRRFFQMDRYTYGEGKRLRWMHPFESDFARKVLNNEDVMISRSVRTQLLCYSEDYEISNCRMIAVPNLSGQTWSSYFWDMKQRLVHVLDPTFDTFRAAELHDLHSPVVDKLQAALQNAISVAYDGWEIDWSMWRKNYIQPFLAGKKSNESGLLTLLAFRNFNGSKFELPQSEGSLKTFGNELLYELLSVEENKGLLPDVFIQSIE